MSTRSFQTLKKRREFLRIRGGARWSSTSFLMEARPRAGLVASGGDADPKYPAETLPARGDASAISPVPVPAPAPAPDPLENLTSPPSGGESAAASAARFGFTVTKKLGNAVVRNRIRRRLKEAVRAVAPSEAKAGCDYVLIARPAALSQQFPELVADIRQAMQRIAGMLDRDGRAGQSSRRPRRTRRK